MDRVIAYEEVLAALAIRDGVRDPPYFVGRQEELGTAAAVYSSGQSGAFVWIHGPRRIGKTSLSLELLRRARERSVLTSRVDLLTFGSDVSFGGLLEAAIANLSEPTGTTTSRDPWSRFSALVRACQRPLLFVFDEMDRLAVHLSEEQQGKMRALKQECPTLRCVFISRIDPNRLIEDYPLVSSRLLGVCNFINLKPLPRLAVRALCTKVREELAIAGDGRAWVDAIWERVGGYSVAVMGLVHRLAVAASVGGVDDPKELERALEDGLLGLRADLENYWWDLPSRTRAALMQITEQKPADWRAVGLWEHDEPVRPSCLVELGRELGRVPRSTRSEEGADGAFGRIHQVHELVATVNESLKLRGYRQPFDTTNDLFKYASAMRGGEDRGGAGHFIDYMYKLCYEAVRDRDGEKGYRLPPPLAEFYKRHPLVGDVSDLRNFLFHDQNRASDSERPSNRFAEAAAVLERHCGTSDPRTAGDWRRLRDSILDDAVALLDELYARAEATELAPGSDK